MKSVRLRVLLASAIAAVVSHQSFAQSNFVITRSSEESPSSSILLKNSRRNKGDWKNNLKRANNRVMTSRSGKRRR